MILKKFSLLILLLTLAFGNVSAERPKVGLVLGGGGARGFAHIAVLELIEEMGIPIDLVIGVSSGAIVGGLYSVGYTPEMIKDSLLDLNWSTLFLDTPVSPFEKELDAGNFLFRYDNSALKSGISPGQTAYTLFKSLTAKIPSYIDFDTLPIPFRAGVVEIPDGKVDLMGQGDLAEAIRASISLPGVFDPFEIDGKFYIDGGTLDNLPIRRAREMGCDIVIASELFPNPGDINFSPIDVPGFMLELYFNTISKEQYLLADAVLKTNIQNTSIMDFQKSREIFSLGTSNKDNMRLELEMVKELLSAGEAYEEAPGSVPCYTDIPPLEINSLSVIGMLPIDRSYIENCFSLLIKGKPLEPQNISDFIRSVFETGNYRFTAARIDLRQGTPELELILHPKNYTGVTFLLGGSYRSTYSMSAINKFHVQGGIHVQGLSGPGSLLFLGASWVNVLSFDMLYLHPLSPRTFIKARTEIVQDKDIIISGFLKREPLENSLSLISSELIGGLLIGRNSIFKTGPLFFISNPGAAITGEDDRNKALGFGAIFTYSSLDFPFFPSSGMYAGFENQFYFPLPFSAPWFFDLATIDLQGVVPLGKGFSFAAGAFIGSGLGSKLSSLGGISAGFTEFDRQYFPIYNGPGAYYAHKAAASIAIQFQPWENLSVFGGQVLFSVSASAGGVLNKLEDFAFNKLIWNASLNTGLRIRQDFGFLLRFGVGSNSYDSLAPFISVDLGQTARSGIKPGR